MQQGVPFVLLPKGMGIPWRSVLLIPFVDLLDFVFLHKWFGYPGSSSGRRGVPVQGLWAQAFPPCSITKFFLLDTTPSSGVPGSTRAPHTQGSEGNTTKFSTAYNVLFLIKHPVAQ